MGKTFQALLAVGFFFFSNASFAQVQTELARPSGTKKKVQFDRTVVGHNVEDRPSKYWHPSAEPIPVREQLKTTIDQYEPHITRQTQKLKEQRENVQLLQEKLERKREKVDQSGIAEKISGKRALDKRKVRKLEEKLDNERQFLESHKNQLSETKESYKNHFNDLTAIDEGRVKRFEVIKQSEAEDGHLQQSREAGYRVNHIVQESSGIRLRHDKRQMEAQSEIEKSQKLLQKVDQSLEKSKRYRSRSSSTENASE